MERGIIKGLQGSWGSGMAVLTVEVGGEDRRTFCENGPTVRALDAAFGDAIGPGHTVNQAGFVGKEIVLQVDDMGLLESFAPAEEVI